MMPLEAAVAEPTDWPSVWPPENYLYRVLASDGLLVRAGASLSSKEVRRLLQHAVISVLGQDVIEGERVRLRTSDGWVSARDSRTGAPLVDRLAPSRFRVVIQDGVLLRAGSELDSEQVGQMPQGALLDVFEEKVNNGGRLRLRTPEGWVSERQMDTAKVLVERLPTTRYRAIASSGVLAREGPEVGSRGLDMIPYDRVVTVCYRVVSDSGQLQLLTHMGWTSERDADGALLLEPWMPPSYRVAVLQGVNVRSGLELDSDTIMHLSHGTTFQPLEQKEDCRGILRARLPGGWVSVSDGRTGERLLEPLAAGARQNEHSPELGLLKASFGASVPSWSVEGGGYVSEREEDWFPQVCPGHASRPEYTDVILAADGEDSKPYCPQDDALLHLSSCSRALIFADRDSKRSPRFH